jgi:histidine triad (HIT) family protein
MIRHARELMKGNHYNISGHSAGNRETKSTGIAVAGENTGEDSCRFCTILRGDAAAQVIYTDDISLAILDHRPLFPGHTLLLPRTHLLTLQDLPDELIDRFFRNVRLLARAVEDGMGADGSFVAVNNRISQSVPHLHVHIVPRRRHDGLKGFFWPRQRYCDEREINRVGELLRFAVKRLEM